MMNCLDCLDLLQNRLDGAAALPAECESHFNECAACRAQQQAGEILLAGLKFLSAPQMSVDFAKGMTALVLEDRRSRRQRRRTRLFVTGALAASLIVMTLAGYFLSPNSRIASVHDDSPAKRPKLPTPNPEVTPRLAQSVDEARQAFAALSERFTENAQKQTKLLLPMQPMQIAGIEDGQASSLDLEPAAKSLQQAGKAVAENLQPVATTARRAIAYFVRELPLFDKKTAVN
jgi:hypothetical protein